MPIVDDVLNGLQIQIDTLWYNFLLSLAGMHWSVERAFLMMGYTIELMNQWLVDNAFTPLIAQTNASLQIVVTASFAVALIVLGITYLLAAFARMRVVEPKSAIAWYLAGALFFALGPQLYQGMTDFRRDLSQAFYASGLSGLQTATGTAFDSLDGVTSSDLGLISLCDNFGSYMPVWNATVDGLDVALAYLRADGIDVMGYISTPRDPACQPHLPDPITGQWTAGQIPWEWKRPGSFFANDRDPVFFPVMTDVGITMGHDLNDLISAPEAARRAGVARNTMHRAARSKSIKSVKIGRDWFVYASDIDRWKREVYRPDMALRYPPTSQEDGSEQS